MKTIECKPPQRFNIPQFPGMLSVFLAGSIEQDTAERWQEKVVGECKDGFLFFNPRRDNWNSSLKQDKTNEQFSEQVNWELDYLAAVDVIFFYFDPKTKSPISLLELGMFAGHKRIIVVCPDGFWRKGNVDIVCSRADVHVFETLDSGIASLQNLKLSGA